MLGTGHPVEHITVLLNSARVTEWCAISRGCIIGPFYKQVNVIDKSYQHMLVYHEFTRSIILL